MVGRDTSFTQQATMAYHPTGETVEILGIRAASNGRSCEEHDICGSVIAEDIVVRIRKVQVVVEGKEEPALAAYWVTKGINRCRVGFLPKHLVPRSKLYEGRLAQVTELYEDNVASFKVEVRGSSMVEFLQ